MCCLFSSGVHVDVELARKEPFGYLLMFISIRLRYAHPFPNQTHTSTNQITSSGPISKHIIQQKQPKSLTISHPSSPPRIPSPSPSTSPTPIQSNINPTPLRHRNFIHPTQISNPLTHPRQFLSRITSIQNTRSSFQRNFRKVLAGTCVVACGTAGEETGWVEAFEGALREGGGCAVGGGLGEGGGGEEEDGDEEGDEEGEMGGEDGHCFFVWGWGFLGDDVGGNVGVGGIAYEMERMCAG